VVRWTQQAADDLTAICQYIARDSPAAAAAFAERVLRAADGAAMFPLAGRAVPETRRSDVRELFVYSYRVIYRVSDSAISILTIYHGARALLEETVASRLPSA
jgi:toxin ParE1/3/4